MCFPNTGLQCGAAFRFLLKNVLPVLTTERQGSPGSTWTSPLGVGKGGGELELGPGEQVPTAEAHPAGV